jgi:hemoglobin-like flavoprotein
MDDFKNPKVAEVFNSYPQRIRPKLMALRQLVLETATEIESVNSLEETLKWGEPSYLTVGGSTIRMDWKESKPEQYAMYFHCKTKLVDTFKELYNDKFNFEGNRAIVFFENDEIPISELKHCILLSLTYHSRKNLPLLGV